jgi:predicted acyltransferase
MGTNLSTQSGSRVVSMDQFRGFTILSMFAVHYNGLFPARAPALAHNNTYLSFADAVLPAFLFASGFALRLSIFRWIAKRGQAAAYARAARRAFILILLLQLFISDRWVPRVLQMYNSHGAGAALDVLLKGGVWESLSVIGLTTLWVLPVIAARARMRVAFLIGGLILHALLCQQFYFAYLFGQPNWLDEWMGANGETGYEGGILGALTWAVPFLTGSLVYDLVAQGSYRRTVRILLAWSAALLVVGYCLSCLANLYPFARTPTTKEYELIKAGDIAKSPVVPPAGDWSDASLSSLAAEPPFVQVPADRQRQLNYWLMSKRVVTPSFVLTATGYALGVYALFIFFCDLMPLRIGVLRTFGQNPLATYILELFILNGLVRRFWPDDSTTALALGHCVIWFALTYLCVRFLEWRGLYLRL